MKKLFLRKKLQADFVEIDEEHHGLKRHLGWLQLIVIGIGAIIGAGIFVITGTAAALYSGPAVVLSFVVASIICVFAGLCYAELSSLIPIAGGSYSYSYVALGELPAWIIGWSLTGQYLFSASTVASGWSGYLASLLNDWGIQIPHQFGGAPLHYEIGMGWSLTGAYLNLPAVILVLLIGFTMFLGIKAAARLTNVMVVIKLATIALFIIIGIPHIDTANWTPFIPPNLGHFGDFGVSGIFRAAGLVFFAYLGFDTVSTLAQDTKNPAKDLPRGILGSLVICTLAYIVVSAILTGIVSYKILNVADPIAVALNAMGPHYFWVVTIVKIAILAGLASVVLVQLLGQTRIFLAIGRDGLLPKTFAKIHSKLRTPVTATLVTTIIAMILTGIFPVEILGQLVSMLTLFIFSIVCLGVWVLRKTHPEFERPFKVPFVPWIPLAGIVCCVAQMTMLPLVTWVQILSWLIVGFIIYFTFSIKNSKIRIEHTAAEDD
ncbi:MAG: amino acid permease [Chlamydiae bacterium CG10_big_fil_rev_8_21_14_0_10_42_34]|nr:MAG: amino acid permease [Chlamydiae bacterium CG10_big_fil_rev_8_21_14_0_10_42_34]